jgi:S-formylglutathione hydrolase FrmB
MRTNGWWISVALLACIATATGKDNWNNPPKEKIPGLEHHTFRSEAVRAEVGFNVCLPPEYSREPQRRFPVVFYLHGYEGNESSYLDYVKHWRASLAQNGPCLLVFVNGGEASFFSDAPKGSLSAETMIVKELVPHVDAKFRTLGQPRARSLHGYSMGGFGALKLAFKHADVFGSVVAYGATLSDAAEFQKHLGKVYAQMFGSHERYDANNPLALAVAEPQRIRDVRVQLIVGTKDDFLNANRELHKRLDAAKVVNEFIELPGVKHDKDPLYEKAAARAFAFSAKSFAESSKR